MPFLAEVRQAKLRRFVTPGSQLSVTGTLVHEGSGYAVTRAAVQWGEQLAAEAELMFRLLPFPSDALRAQMQRHATGMYASIAPSAEPA
jgi:3-hydroxyacyl-[acyl-carrier-protein] dehydratase